MKPETQGGPLRPRDLFLIAVEKAPAERGAFLLQMCGADEQLRADVEELLREHEQVGSFLELPALLERTPGSTMQLTTTLTDAVEKAGDRIGRYKLLQQIGEGGCGIVYMAEQEEPVRRRVALKIIKLGMDTRSVIARFEAERQALAMMEHPNIAKVFDAGATETGRPYFVMELVRGVRITEYCDQKNLRTEERLRLFAQVCQAIQHAHQKGVIHRDIKPSNILVTLHDSVAVPKVIDFGIAKATQQRLTDKTLFTEFQSFIGTPAYMSPEQAEMSGLDIDTRSDIYALGVLLYEMLTGTTPFDPRELMKLGLDGVRQTIRDKEPARPSTRLATMLDADLTTTAQQRQTEPPKLIRALRGDLDWIVMKCLEKDRTRRYATANDLAADVQRYLEGDTVFARPPSNIYRLKKLLRRHRGVVAAAAAIIFALLTGTVISTWQAVRATIAERSAESAERLEKGLRRRAERESASARLNEYVADINLAQQSLAAENYGRAVQLLDKHRPEHGQLDLRDFAWRYLWQLTRGDEHVDFPALNEPVQSVALSPDGEWLVAGTDHKLTVWNARTKAQVAARSYGATAVAFTSDGKSLIVASTAEFRAPGNIRILSVADWSEQKMLPGYGGPIALSEEGGRLVTQSREGLKIWDTTTWETVRTVRDAGSPFSLSSDGKKLVFDRRSGAGLAMLLVNEEQPPLILEGATNLFVRAGFTRSDRTLVFSPDGKFIVAARNLPSEHGVFTLGVWDAESGQEVEPIPEDTEHPEHTGRITSIVFSQDGRRLATASMDHSIRVWDFYKRQRVRALQGNQNEVWAVAFSRDGQNIASGSKDGAVKLWPLERPDPREDFAQARLPLGFSTNKAVLAALSRDNNVLFLNLDTGEVEKEFPLASPQNPFIANGPRPFGVPGFRLPTPVAVSSDLKILATTFSNGMVKLWNTDNRESTTLRVSEHGLFLLALSPDGRTLITRGWERALHWWDLNRGTNFTTETDSDHLLFSPTGETLALFDRENRVEIWNVANRSLITNFVVEPAFAPPGTGARENFSPDGKLLAIACQDDAVRLWDVNTAKLVGTLIGHKQTVVSVAFSPQGKTLATASDDSTLKFWNIATQQELLSIRRLGGGLRALTFSPDGRFLVAGTSSTLLAGGLRVFRAPLLPEIDAAP